MRGVLCRKFKGKDKRTGKFTKKGNTMLFNSEIFIFVFLPILLIGFFKLSSYNVRLGIIWLILASIVFYGLFRIDHLLLLAGLIVFNYFFGIKLSKLYQSGTKNSLLLLIGVGVNLTVLIYYKYTNFILSNINVIFNTKHALQTMVMPIGISFFIFQKIAYLVDAYRGQAKEYNFLDFTLFVMYFPQLIAGPIVHHKDLIPQFRSPSLFKLNLSNLSVGLMMFTLGLCKKVIIADHISGWVNPAFSAAQQGGQLSFLEAWAAALGFTFQIYFDFSAYSDMALALALMIGIHLPINFNSPYKAQNIIDFWRRWHMSLSKFLRDYIYIPLGGNQLGLKRRYLNLLFTMLIGGLWHGAAWTFIFWGALHGFYLITNHAWQALKKMLEWDPKSVLYSKACQIITFLSIIIAWLFFRAENFRSALNLLKSMTSINRIVLPESYVTKLGSLSPILQNFGIRFDNSGVAYLFGANHVLFLMGLLLMVWFLPNTQQWCAQYEQKNRVNLNQKWSWFGLLQPQDDASLTLQASSFLGAMTALVILSVILWQNLSKTSLQTFIYFQF